MLADLIAEYLEACTRREMKRLIINIPPPYMKSVPVWGRMAARA
jgi:hypothetical protein